MLLCRQVQTGDLKLLLKMMGCRKLDLELVC